MNNCNCKMCQRNVAVMDIIKRYSMIEADKLILINILTELIYAETEAQYYELKYKGKWPSLITSENNNFSCPPVDKCEENYISTSCTNVVLCRSPKLPPSGPKR